MLLFYSGYYSILGGIPFYLDCFNPSLSLAQNIDSLFFNARAKLFTKMLKTLIASDFVTKYVPWGCAANEEYHKLADCFCWFWLHFKEEKAVTERDYWLHHIKESEIAAWRGAAFQTVRTI